ncbi:MAG TPA: DUF3604 domain-containing protein [Kofleriaceae bacterium]|nr:DUF3604 domain-containing protein [Kofleriaceae bacterium]
MNARSLLACTSIVAAVACGSDPDPRIEVLGRCADNDPTRRPFFGDLHVHTSLSLDANLKGTQLGPVDAYRFARGESVGLPPYDAQGGAARSLQLARPLDFVALTDHAEFLGLMQTCTTPGSAGYDHPNCVNYRNSPSAAFLGLNAALSLEGAIAPAPCTDNGCPQATLDAWAQVQTTAEGAYDRTPACQFTSFVAYEWSGSPGTRNLHRNVIFRNHVVPRTPFTYFDSDDPEDLWAALARQCTDGDSACDVLTIPHNSNLSSGLMFDQLRRDGSPFDADYVRTRAAMEPLVEVFQHKSDSECLPEQAEGGDPLCSFEKSPYHTLSAATLGGDRVPANPRDYVRDALGQGLALGAQLGTNPFAYGIVASTDTHQSIPGAVDEQTFAGHGGAGAAATDWRPDRLADLAWFNPGGLAVLWAEENSREALFAAMRRREAYGTSGPRIVLRFFAGDYADDLCAQPDFAARGYATGVPMGADLPAEVAAPAFAVWAQRDPGSASRPGMPLQRVQIVKGWLDGDTPRFQVFEVAGDASNGAGVDLATCTPTGAGADELCAVWRDPSYDPSSRAFYYARAVENPSCRWHTAACNALGVDCAAAGGVPPELAGCCDPDMEATIQERAWSSPIWTGVASAAVAPGAP